MEMKERSNPETGMDNRNPRNILIDVPFQQTNIKPVNGQHAANEEEEKEEDLILGDEDELEGDEEIYDVELEDDLDEDDIDEDDLVIGADDIDEDEDEDL